MATSGTVVLTGASRGLGRVAAEQILRADPGIHLVVIARGDGDRLAADLARVSGNPAVSAMSCDLASLSSLRDAAGELDTRIGAGELPALTGFVGNAGLQMTTRSTTTDDGFETTFAVNVLANYLFVRLLWDRFTPGSRIVLVGSDTHFGDLRHNLGMVPAPRWEDVRELARARHDAAARTATEGRTAYSTSKLAVIYLVHALARRLPADVDVYSFNPGYVPGTGLVRDAGPVVRALSRTVLHALTATPLALTPAKAGALLAAAATGPRPGDTGSYIDRTTVAASAPQSYDTDREEQLWAAAATFCALPAEPRHTR